MLLIISLVLAMSDNVPKQLSSIQKAKLARIERDVVSSSITKEDVKELLREHGGYTKGSVKLTHVYTLLRASDNQQPIIDTPIDKKGESFQVLEAALELAGYKYTPENKKTDKTTKKKKKTTKPKD